eukprot:CFRG3846T1
MNLNEAFTIEGSTPTPDTSCKLNYKVIAGPSDVPVKNLNYKVITLKGDRVVRSTIPMRKPESSPIPSPQNSPQNSPQTSSKTEHNVPLTKRLSQLIEEEGSPIPGRTSFRRSESSDSEPKRTSFCDIEDVKEYKTYEAAHKCNDKPFLKMELPDPIVAMQAQGIHQNAIVMQMDKLSGVRVISVYVI